MDYANKCPKIKVLWNISNLKIKKLNAKIYYEIETK